MRLPKQNRTINFAGGTDTKTDPFQMQIGAFTFLYNSVFTMGGLLAKRNGFTPLASLPYASTYLTTFKDAPVAIGSTLQGYSPSLNTWNNQGSMTPLQLSTQPLVRSNTSQTQVDVATAPNGIACIVYTDQDPTRLSNRIARYSIIDTVNDQVIVAPTQITEADTTYPTPKVYYLNNYFVIVYSRLVSATYHLRYFAISVYLPTQIAQAAADISSSYTPSVTTAFDGAVLNNTLYLAWNGSAASGLKVGIINSFLQLVSPVTPNPDPAHQVSVVSVCADSVNNIVYVAYYFNQLTSDSFAYIMALSPACAVLLAATQFFHSASLPLVNITTIVNNGLLNVLYELGRTYDYDGSLANNIVDIITCTLAGSLVGPTLLRNGVGLASKAFLYNGSVYWLAAFQSQYQPTYFLMDSSGKPIAKLAYSNGAGYLPTGLPTVSVNGATASIAYLYKDLIQAVNKGTALSATTQTAGIYAQTGINLANFTFGTDGLLGAEIGSNLNLTGGFCWAFDGVAPVEQGFFLWPEAIEATWTAVSTVVVSGTVTSGSTVISSIGAGTTGIYFGMTITGTGVPAGATVVRVGASSVTMSAPGTSTHTGNCTYQGNVWAQPDGATNTNAYWYQFTYEWSDNQGNIFRSAPSIPLSVTTTGAGIVGIITLTGPTLRLTYKTNVKIVGYRYSVKQQAYYQFTSILYPVLNDPTANTWTFVDTQTDGNIIGNNLLYTTGGTVENIGAPAFNSLFMFDDRLFGITSEDTNSMWFTNQILDSGTPVEFSDLLTYYVAPNIATQGSTGPLTCGAAMDDKAILFKASAIYYMNGVGPDATGANSQFSQPTFVTSTVGCSNQKSIVFQPEGLMFEFKSAESGNQIWKLGRDLSTQYIGAAVEAYTQNATVQSAINIPGTNEVRFTLSSGITLMYDYYYNKWGQFINCPATTSTLYNGVQLYLDSLSRALIETPGVYLDNASPVLMSFQTGWLNLAGLQGYMRSYYFFLLGNYLTPHKLQMSIASDYNPTPNQTYTCSPNNYNSPYGVSTTYGSGNYGGKTSVEQFRNNLKQQRCQSFQITLQEVYDPSFGVPPGAGLTLSGINLVYGVKLGYPKLGASQSVG